MWDEKQCGISVDAVGLVGALLPGRLRRWQRSGGGGGWARSRPRHDRERRRRGGGRRAWSRGRGGCGRVLCGSSGSGLLGDEVALHAAERLRLPRSALAVDHCWLDWERGKR